MGWEHVSGDDSLGVDNQNSSVDHIAESGANEPVSEHVGVFSLNSEDKKTNEDFSACERGQ